MSELAEYEVGLDPARIRGVAVAAAGLQEIKFDPGTSMLLYFRRLA